MAGSSKKGKIDTLIDVLSINDTCEQYMLSCDNNNKIFYNKRDRVILPWNAITGVETRHKKYKEININYWISIDMCFKFTKC